MDIEGIGFCKKHEDDVSLAYVALMQGDKEVYEAIIESKRKIK